MRTRRRVMDRGSQSIRRIGSHRRRRLRQAEIRRIAEADVNDSFGAIAKVLKDNTK